MPFLLQIALGGALGALARVGVTTFLTRALGAGFPWGTGIVNVAGSFLMGAVLVLVLRNEEMARHAPLIGPGFLGGFTTFSAFALDALVLAERGRALAAGGYVLGSVALSLIAVALGAWVARGLSA
jgi:CrcB protein